MEKPTDTTSSASAQATAAGPWEHARECCREFGLSPARDAGWLLDIVDDPEAIPACCDSACDPCVLTIQRAARALARKMKPSE